MNSIAMAQNKETQNADKLYNKFEYVSASEAYLKLVSNGLNKT